MKYGQQRLVAGRKNYIFFLCPLDGEQFTPREYLLFIASFIISVLCRYLSLYEINSRYMHLNEVFCLFAFLPKRIA